MATRRQHDSSGASARDDDDTGAMRSKRRRVRGVGIFIGKGEAGEPGCFQWPALMPRLEGIVYRSQEGEGV
jgi:hypothetical protein